MKSITLSMAGAVLAVFTAYGCGGDAERTDLGEAARETGAATQPTDAARTSNAPGGEVRVADLTGNPDRYFGQTVTVVADVEEVHTPMAFSLDEDAPLEGGIDRDLLVFSPKAGNLADIDDQWLNNKVKVTGKVGKMTVVEVEREVGWDLNPEIEAEVERAGAVLIATSIERVGDRNENQR